MIAFNSDKNCALLGDFAWPQAPDTPLYTGTYGPPKCTFLRVEALHADDLYANFRDGLEAFVSYLPDVAIDIWLDQKRRVVRSSDRKRSQFGIHRLTSEDGNGNARLNRNRYSWGAFKTFQFSVSGLSYLLGNLAIKSFFHCRQARSLKPNENDLRASLPHGRQVIQNLALENRKPFDEVLVPGFGGIPDLKILSRKIIAATLRYGDRLRDPDVIKCSARRRRWRGTYAIGLWRLSLDALRSLPSRFMPAKALTCQLVLVERGAPLKSKLSIDGVAKLG